MKIEKTLLTLSLLTSFAIAGCGETETKDAPIPKNFTGNVTLKCSQQTASKEMKYLFTAQASLVDGSMKSWGITQQSPYTPVIGRDFDTTVTLMSDGAQYIKTNSSGHQIAESERNSGVNTMYITDDMRTGLFTNRHRDNFYFYCTPKI